MLVSVIVATYRREKTLERAIQSIIDQTYKNVEIIVCDDNSNDEWNEKVQKITNKFSEFSNLVYIKNKVNMGSARTRNVGIEKASGEYITFLDDDDIYLPKKIENQINAMVENKSDYSVTDLELFSENDKLIEKRTRHYIKEIDKESLFKNHLMHHITGTDTMMFKREYLINIGGFEPIDVGDEFYLMQKAIEFGGKFNYLRECDVKAYVHSNTDGLSSGDSKINGENSLFNYKKQFFCKLDKKTIKYIKMRHYAVLAFAEIRRKMFLKCFKYLLKSFSNYPSGFIQLVKDAY